MAKEIKGNSHRCGKKDRRKGMRQGVKEGTFHQGGTKKINNEKTYLSTSNLGFLGINNSMFIQESATYLEKDKCQQKADGHNVPKSLNTSKCVVFS